MEQMDIIMIHHRILLVIVMVVFEDYLINAWERGLDFRKDKKN